MAALSFPVLVWVTTLYHIPSHLSAGKSAGKTAGRAGALLRPACMQNVLPPGWTARLQHQAASSSFSSSCVRIQASQRPSSSAGYGETRRVRAPARRPAYRSPYPWSPTNSIASDGIPQRALHPSIRFGVAWGFSASKICSSKHPSSPSRARSASPPSRLEFEHSTSRMPRSRRRRSRPARTHPPFLGGKPAAAEGRIASRQHPAHLRLYRPDLLLPWSTGKVVVDHSQVDTVVVVERAVQIKTDKPRGSL